MSARVEPAQPPFAPAIEERLRRIMPAGVPPLVSLLIRLCDALAQTCDVDDALWQALRDRFSAEAVMEMLLLAGFYRTVAYLTNVLRLPPEPFAAQFPPRPVAPPSDEL
jgi:hypothetical protein